jgi:DNA-binding response OmpR family regulator
VIFLTAKNQVEDEAMGLSLGAVDYLAKPISPPILFARVSTHLHAARRARVLQDRTRTWKRWCRAHRPAAGAGSHHHGDGHRWRKRATTKPATISAAPRTTCGAGRKAAGPPALQPMR